MSLILYPKVARGPEQRCIHLRRLRPAHTTANRRPAGARAVDRSHVCPSSKDERLMVLT